VLLAIMDISARAISLCDRPQSGQLGQQYSQAPGRPNLHLILSSRRPRREATLRCSRFLAASIQGLSPWRSQLLGLISTTHAACTNRTRKLIDLPYFEVPTVSQKAPGDAGELVGEHDRQHVGKGLVNGFNRSFRLI